MLRSIHTLLGAEVAARDGAIGHLRDALFDDSKWVVRYLVADTGNWLSGREVLLSPSAVRELEVDAKVVHVDLDKTQVESSPPVSTDLPVARQHEAALSLHYGWPSYWAPELAAALPEPPPAEPVSGDPHLRSAREVIGYSVTTMEGEFGQVEDLFMDQTTWFIRYLVVASGKWLGSQKLLVSTQSVGSISWNNREVHLPHSRSTL